MLGRAFAASFWQNGSLLIMSNANVRLEYNLSTGNPTFFWNNSQKISAFYSGVGLKSGYVKGINFAGPCSRAIKWPSRRTLQVCR